MAPDREVLNEISWERFEDVLVLCTGRRPPSDADLERWLERLGAGGYKYLLVCARGDGGPDTKQRGRIGRFWKESGRPVPPTVMLTDSSVARMILTAISWVTGSELKGMREGEWQAALDYLGASSHPDRVARVAEQLHMEMNQIRQRKVG